MPPSSGELWGHHLMPPTVDVDCLLPTGIIICLRCKRDVSLEGLKLLLWKESKRYPLYYLLSDPTSYIFVSITQDAEKEEFYDETRRLCDLRLFQPILKVVEPKGNRAEKMLNYEIGIAIGSSVNEFNEIKDLEVITFRRNILSVCNEAVDCRDMHGLHSQALYVYPPDVESDPQLPSHIEEKVYNHQEGIEHRGKIIVCIWVLSANGDRQSYKVKLSHLATPDMVIAEAILKKTRSMDMSSEQQKQCVLEYRDSYVLKVCGCEQFLLEKYPISQYKHIRFCVLRGLIPQLMLMSKDSVYATLPRNTFTMPSYAHRGISALENIQQQKTIPLWGVNAMLQIRINCATYVNVKETGSKVQIYVKTGIYHGTEALCPLRDTAYVDSSNPRWHEWVVYDLYIPDIPRSARLCLAICSVSKKKRREVHVPIAWGNINLFDFNHRLRSDKFSIHLWQTTSDELLNPILTPGSNPNKDSACLEIEFERFEYPVTFPTNKEIEEYANWVSSLDPDSVHGRGSTTYIPSTPNQFTEDQQAEDTLKEIIARDPLAEISEQDKELLWRMRKQCQRIPDSLPKLLNAVKWHSRSDVSQIYVLLKDWPTVSPEVALELLDCTFTDLNVRKFATRCLEEGLMDEKLSQYLLQLVQVLKFEPYLDNPLTRFLIKKSLLNQKIGHFFFWHLKSEMNQMSIRLRFGLILEAYCRGSGAYLKSLNRQVEALEKLTKLTDGLKQERDDDQLKFFIQNVNQADYLEALQNFPSPLNNSHILGELQIDKCKVMGSSKRPLRLLWTNNDPMADQHHLDYQSIFKNGDDLRQDMLTLQVIGIMDSIWQSEGLDLRMMPYGCLATGKHVGLIEVVKKAKTVMNIQRASKLSAIQMQSKQLHKWIKENNQKEDYETAIDTFKRSCAGYCVATFVLGIGDRNPDNIMVTEGGQVFHIDYGHFLNHRKKKFGINRERVPFVLTDDFIYVIAKGNEKARESDEFGDFMELCGKAYYALRKHANIFITLFSLMLSCGIPELQSLDDIGYLRKTLQVDNSEESALHYFQQQFHEAYGGGWTTKLDWFFHYIKHRNS